MARATTMACHEGLGGSSDGKVERVRLDDGLRKRENLKFSFFFEKLNLKFFDQMGLLRVNCIF